MPCLLTVERGSSFVGYGGGTHTHSKPSSTRRVGREFEGFGMQRAVERLRGLSTSPFGLDRSRQISTGNEDACLALRRVDEQSARGSWVSALGQTLEALTECSVLILKRTLNMARVFPLFVRAAPDGIRQG